MARPSSRWMRHQVAGAGSASALVTRPASASGRPHEAAQATADDYFWRKAPRTISESKNALVSPSAA
jgi:hypothetical protein